MGLFTRTDELEERGVISDYLETEIAARAAGFSHALGQEWIIPAVYRAIQMTTDAIAQLPLEVKDADGLLVDPQPGAFRHPVHGLTRQGQMSRIMSSLLWDGNAYIRLLDNDRRGYPSWIQVLDPAEINVEWNEERTKPVYEWRGEPVRAVTDGRANAQLLHIPLNLYPGRVRGVGPITAARLLFDDISVANQYSRDWFRDGGVPSGTLETPNPMSEKEIQILKATWDSARDGKANTGVLANGLSYKSVKINPVDMAFLEQKVHSIGEIARIFGIPGPLLGWAIEGGSSVVYQTTSTMAEWFARFTLVPTYVSRIEEELSTILPSTQRAVFDLGPFTRGDTKSRYEAYQIAIAAGFMSVDEVRDLEGFQGKAPAAPPAIATPQFSAGQDA